MVELFHARIKLRNGADCTFTHTPLEHIFEAAQEYSKNLFSIAIYTTKAPRRDLHDELLKEVPTW